MAKRRGVLCLGHTSTQAAKPFTVSVSTQTCWDVWDDSLGPATPITAQRAAREGGSSCPAPARILSGGPEGVHTWIQVLRNVPKLSVTETAISSRA